MVSKKPPDKARTIGSRFRSAATGNPDIKPSRSRPANWLKWQHMRVVELWQAVALTFDVEPDSLPVYLGAFDVIGDDPFRICPAAYLDRLEIATSNCGTIFGIVPSHALKARGVIDLPEFGAWAAATWPDLPEQFPIAEKLAQPAGTLTSKSSNETAAERDERCLKEREKWQGGGRLAKDWDKKHMDSTGVSPSELKRRLSAARRRRKAAEKPSTPATFASGLGARNRR